MTVLKYLVYLRPPQELSDELGLYRVGIKEHITHIPSAGDHCTLMTGRFDEKDEKKIIDDLQDIVTQPFLVSLENLEMFGNNPLVARLKTSVALMQLHLAVIENLCHYLNWPAILPLDKNDSTLNTPERKKVYERYGAPVFGQFYNPHITIADINPTLQQEEIPKATFLNYSWHVKDWYLLKKENGIWKMLRRFRLEK